MYEQAISWEISQLKYRGHVQEGLLGKLFFSWACLLSSAAVGLAGITGHSLHGRWDTGRGPGGKEGFGGQFRGQSVLIL